MWEQSSCLPLAPYSAKTACYDLLDALEQNHFKNKHRPGAPAKIKGHQPQTNTPTKIEAHQSQANMKVK